ncbi:MAG: D-alanine--D-alanine ligase family protein [Aureispira sp.]
MRIGIFFGGSSREREISFAGGRTVYDNLDKSLFTPVPIFVDSLGQFVLLNWSYLYKGTIRDFYPAAKQVPFSPNHFQVYIESLHQLSAQERQQALQEIGQPLTLDELPALIDFAFLALHGSMGEDGQLQGVLDFLQIPYSGSGIRASSIGMDKSYQKKLMEAAGFDMPKMVSISRADWWKGTTAQQLNTWSNDLGWPLVVRPANQGSSIGVRIVHQREELAPAIDAAFFMETLSAQQWTILSLEEKVDYLRVLTDIRTGIGFPLQEKNSKERFYHPETLLTYLDTYFEHSQAPLTLQGLQSEHTVVLESFIKGKEFSCVVVRGEENEAIALPPTEILKGQEVFDYRSKYLAGLSRKRTPIDLPYAQIEQICQACESLFSFLDFNTYARIDGFIQADGRIFLNDPNTTSGMLPSSFFFHQAAEIGLNPSQFLSYIIRTSLQERIQTTTNIGQYEHLLEALDLALAQQQQTATNKEKVAVFLGGYSSERHISVESGRNIYEKLASSDRYEPLPVFVTGNSNAHQLYHIPINLLLKDNADDIRDKLLNYQQHSIIKDIQERCQAITSRYTQQPPIFAPEEWHYPQLAEKVDSVFIALHGRPGEDGAVQKELQAYNLPFNGSLATSAAVTIDKYETLQRLKAAGLPVTEQLLISQQEVEQSLENTLDNIEKVLHYPFIGKPVDDGCSSAVKLLKNRAQVAAFLKALFRTTPFVNEENSHLLQLKPKEEFPQKKIALLEALITQEDAVHFLEITGGLLTHYGEQGELRYEIFEPSEALATGEILSLEEKFLAGEGQNITPARFILPEMDFDHEHISKQVRATLQQAAELLQITGYARIDAFVRIYPDGRAETLIIEVNSLPGMTPATCIFHQCAINGYKPYEFIDQILKFGTQRTQQPSLGELTK